jgi:diguanylate cyclase (GGDEF)-like protein
MQPGAQGLTSELAEQSLNVDPHGFAASTAILVAGLLLLLFFYRRKRYILYWAAAWMLSAVSLLIISARIQSLKLAAFALGLSQFVGILSALVFVVSADAYRSRPRFRRGYVIALLPLLIWFTMSPLVIKEIDTVFAPGHLLIGGALAAAGVAHVGLLRHQRLLGALVCGCMMLVTAGAHFWIAYNVTTPNVEEVSRVMLLMTVVFILTALGMQLMTFEDMTYELRVTNRRLETAREELLHAATTDSLTGCHNRRFLEQVMDRELKRHARFNLPLSLLFIDIDRFKAVNDTLGHDAGDRVLQYVARFLKRHIREADYVFRWGGDEFLVLITCAGDEARRKTTLLKMSFDAAPEAIELPPGIGLSVGSIEVPAGTTDLMPIIAHADTLMYQDKGKRPAAPQVQAAHAPAPQRAARGRSRKG